MHHRKLTVVLIVASLILSTLLFGFFGPGEKKPPAITARKTVAKVAAPKAAYHGLPMRLLIPSISVTATIETMGLTSQGDMQAPQDSSNVGWYKFGAIPGDAGSAVIDGHIVGPAGQAGVFYNLHKLQVGDSLSVIDGKGQSTTFVVREIRSYNQGEQHSEVFEPHDKAHLNIITCSGEWSPSQHHYLQRLVVFADISK